ncbi:MAG TPA: hypothetical protein PK536_10920 [Ignavibacteria bacterium]|nr:hypothetical protein [Bacteroidota bacterium]HRI85945.1 hypothetical protein [Ignavibacteria bacterium]HRK00506.1 hypothetical protein [Ignavibacteria bacterium]
MFKTKDGSTGRLIELCIFYFLFYVVTGVSVKYFLGSSDLGFPGMKNIQYLVYSTAGGTLLALSIVLVLKWYKIQTNGYTTFLGMKMPEEFLYIIPSGVCTAVIIPTTTLMYSLPISVMVAMVIMRGSVIIISRVVDALQIRSGILKKKVYMEENIAVVFAIIAVCINLLWQKDGGFDFIYNAAAVIILTSYIIAYSIRIYIMNYYKNTRGKDVKQDNKGFFAVEQIAAFLTMVVVGIFIYFSPQMFGWTGPQITEFVESINNPVKDWGWAVFAGTAFGAVAFFSVFIFMFKGRTATFAGLVNRLTSLIAGTAATLIFHYFFGGKFPGTSDWVSLIFILISVAFITMSEKKRSAELKKTHEIDED